MDAKEHSVWIPPSDWVAFSDVGKWIELRFLELPSVGWIQDIFDAIQQNGMLVANPVRHRVQGLNETNVSFGAGNSRNPITDSPGLKLASPDHARNGVRDVVVAEWDKAGFDSRTFTVAGRQSGGGRSRHPIEVYWIDVQRRIQAHIKRRSFDQAKVAARTPAPANASPFSGLSPEVQELIQRQSEAQRAWENNPANKDEREFGWDVVARRGDFEDRIKGLKIGPIADMAKYDERLDILTGELEALKEDEDEVRSTPPTERPAVIERVRRRWKERDRRRRGLVTADLGRGEEHSQEPAGVAAHPPSSGNPVMNFAPQEWSDATAGDEGIPGSASSRIAARRDRAGRTADVPISLAELPACWTFYQAVAWIMFRNVALVQRVNGLSLLQFQLELNYVAAVERVQSWLTTINNAEDALLVRLRAGAVEARGMIAGRDGYQAIEVVDWIVGKMDENGGQPVLIPARSKVRFWHDVLLPKEQIVSAWPCFSIQVSSVSEGLSVPPVNAEHGITVLVPEQKGGRMASATEILISSPAISAKPIVRTAGRPNARKTSISLYERRRTNGYPLMATQLAEAEAIIAMWPMNGPPRPNAKTVSGHISALWSARDKTRDKL